MFEVTNIFRSTDQMSSFVIDPRSDDGPAFDEVRLDDEAKSRWNRPSLLAHTVAKTRTRTLTGRPIYHASAAARQSSQDPARFDSSLAALA